MSFHTLRKTDVGLVLSILLIIGALWKGYAKPAAWDEAVKDVELMKPRLSQCEKDVTELRGINATQMALIIRELDGMHREMRALRTAKSADRD